METIKPAQDTALCPPRILMHPKEEKYLDGGRRWQGIPSVERTKQGRLYVVFYSGMTGEMSGNFTVLTESRNGGRTWNGVTAVVEHTDPEMRVFDPNLWIDPQGRLWLFWAQSRGLFDGRHGVWAAICDTPDADDPAFGEPFRIANGVMMNKPLVKKDGTWVFPCAVWAFFEGTGPVFAREDMFSNIVVSSDKGNTFTKLGGADIPDRCFDEHMIVELRDGRLWMLVRTHYGIGQSFSSDGGRTWSPGEDSGIAGPCSRFFIRRLRSGSLLLVNHVDFDGRNNLTALLSEDDGKTWRHSLRLDGRSGVSYPDGVEDDSGTIYIVYDHSRYDEREILMARFTEADILAGECVTEKAMLRIPVNRAFGQKREKEPR